MTPRFKTIDLVQWFPTAGRPNFFADPQNSFFSTKLILIRNRKHYNVVTFCKTYVTLNRFTAVTWRIMLSLITKKIFNDET